MKQHRSKHQGALRKYKAQKEVFGVQNVSGTGKGMLAHQPSRATEIPTEDHNVGQE